MHSNGLTLTCRPKRGHLPPGDFEALKKDGYGYSKTEFCKLEVAPGSSPTLADAVTVGALQVEYEDGKCVVIARAWFPHVNVHTGFMHGYTYEPSCRRWTKPMTPADFQELQSLAPKDSTVSIERAVGRKFARVQDLDLVGVPLSSYTPSPIKMLGSEEAVERWHFFHDNYDFSCGMYGAAYPAPLPYEPPSVPSFLGRTLPVTLARPDELWLPGDFNELPDALVERYMDEYKSGLSFRMGMRELKRLFTFGVPLHPVARTWCDEGNPHPRGDFFTTINLPECDSIVVHNQLWVHVCSMTRFNNMEYNNHFVYYRTTCKKDGYIWRRRTAADIARRTARNIPTSKFGIWLPL